MTTCIGEAREQMAEAEQVVADLASRIPDLLFWGNDIAELLEGGTLDKTGDFGRDLMMAYLMVSSSAHRAQ